LTRKLHAVQNGDTFSWPTRCPSCLANANGHYCATCGETLRPHLPSASEFVHEFIGRYVALEGKLPRTLALLLFRPGRLTIDFLHGRRLPTIAPLRLYLTLSLIMFAMIKWCGIELPQLQLNNALYGISYSHSLLNPDQVRTALVALGKVNETWMHNVQAFMAQPAAQQGRTLNHGFLAYLPYMLIAALPLFGLYLKLLYRGTGRVYGEHLVFALHANAFAFLLASVMVAFPGNVAWLVLAIIKHQVRLISFWDVLQLLPCIWLLAYLPVAMRRVYGGTRLATGARWLLLITVHVLVIAALTIAAELIAIAGQS
jgi:hypothetical protein